jgi:hypothetical protein
MCSASLFILVFMNGAAGVESHECALARVCVVDYDREWSIAPARSRRFAHDVRRRASLGAVGQGQGAHGGGVGRRRCAWRRRRRRTRGANVPRMGGARRWVVLCELSTRTLFTSARSYARLPRHVGRGCPSRAPHLLTNRIAPALTSDVNGTDRSGVRSHAGRKRNSKCKHADALRPT